MIVELKQCFECNKQLDNDNPIKYKIHYGKLYPICYQCWVEFMGIKK